MSSETPKKSPPVKKRIKIPDWPSPSFKCANPSKPCMYCNIEPQSAGKSPKKAKRMHIYPSSGAGMLFGCECGEVSGTIPLDVTTLWLRTAEDKILN